MIKFCVLFAIWMFWGFIIISAYVTFKFEQFDKIDDDNDLDWEAFSYEWAKRICIGWPNLTDGSISSRIVTDLEICLFLSVWPYAIIIMKKTYNEALSSFLHQNES